MKSVKRFQPILRYPGSKDKLVGAIAKHFDQHLAGELFSSNAPSVYIEPFIGSGAVAGRIAPRLPNKTSMWINDKDYWLVCLWQSLLQEIDQLCERIDAFTPTTSLFSEWKAQDGAKIDPIEAGFRKVALHYMSFSGLGAMAGGPIGGKDQSNKKYSIDCRWRPANLKRNYKNWHIKLHQHRSRITCMDFRTLLKQAPADAFVYLDPPYYEKGPQLYKHSLNDEHHDALAGILRNASFTWVLSYDDHPRIRELYRWATIREINATYTTATARNGSRPKNQEVVILP